MRRDQLVAAGLDPRAITRWVRDGRLHRVYRAVYALGHRALSREGLWLAGVFAAGPGAALSHLCCAALFELRKLRTDFVTAIAPKHRAPKGPIRVYECRGLDPRDVTVRRGIPVTTIARMCVDLTDMLTPPELANVIHEADFKGVFDEAAVHDSMARANGRHNLAVLTRALELNAAGSAGVKSGNETAFLRIAGKPEPLTNVLVLGEEVDALWPELKLVVEVDGVGHLRTRTRLDDRRRDAKLRAAGYTVLRVRDTELKERPEWVRARLAAARRRLGG